MRAFSPEFSESLARGATTLATCWILRRRDGSVFGFTDHDRPLAVDGVLCDPAAGADAMAFDSAADLSVDNTSVEGVLSSDRLSAVELFSGRFDGARVEIWRVDWRNPAARALLKRMTVGEVKRQGARFVAELRGPAFALEEPRGRVYQRGCDAVLGDARCGVDLTEPQFFREGAVAEIISDGRFRVEGLVDVAPADFAGGRLDWLGGANAGTSAEVLSASATEIAIAAAPARAIGAGDAFRLVAGCDKTFATCRGRFQNAENFRGFPYIPGDDAVLTYPLRGENNDGGRRR